MKATIKIFAKIVAGSLLKWLSVFVTGFLFTILFAVLVIVKIDFATFFAHLTRNNIIGFILLLTVPVFVVLYFLAANKIAVEAAIHGVWKHKAEPFIQPRIAKVVEKINSNPKAKAITDASMLRLQLREINNSEGRSKPQVRVVDYIIKKIYLDDIDFKKDDLKLSEVISRKISNLISDVTEPSFIPFFALAGIQVLLLLILYYFNS